MEQAKYCIAINTEGCARGAMIYYDSGERGVIPKDEIKAFMVKDLSSVVITEEGACHPKLDPEGNQRVEYTGLTPRIKGQHASFTIIDDIINEEVAPPKQRSYDHQPTNHPSDKLPMYWK